MSGMEVVAVIGCVAAVVSAYKDGGYIVQQIKAKRKAKKALPPTTMLETSLQRGSLAVETAKDEGIERYGPQFAVGDRIACDALKDILIHLQGTLLRNLAAAQNDDNHTDFNILVDASDMGRMKSITVLHELYMRLAQAGPFQKELPAPSRIQTLDSIESSGSPWHSGQHQSPQIEDQVLLSSPPQSLSAQPPSAQTSFAPRDPAQEPDPVKYPRPPKSRWLHISKSRKDSAPLDSDHPGLSTLTSELTISDPPQGIHNEARLPSTWNSPSLDIATLPAISKARSEDVVPSSLLQTPRSHFILEDNPWEDQVSSSQSVADTSAPNLKQQRPLRRSTEATLVDKDIYYGQTLRPHTPESQASSDPPPLAGDGRSPYEPRPSKMKLPSWSRRRSSGEGTRVKEDISQSTKPSQKSRISPVMTRSSSTQSSQPTPNLDAKNSYSGFCVGAYKMQVGFEQESLKLKNASISMGGEMHYWACINKNCVFEGPAWKSSKTWNISNAVRIRNGVQYRWKFLAKSHVALSRTSGRAFDYQCIFCISQGQPAAVYRTEPAFIEHVSTHRGQRAELKLSDKFCCIDDRVAKAEEDFDINLTPPRTALSGDSSLQGQSLVASPEPDTHSTDRGFPWTPAGPFLGC